MSLIQRNVIPIIVLLAVIGVGLTVLAVTTPFASGQETETCEPGVGISIATTNSDGQTVAVVDHGDDVFYTVRLFKDQSLCDFGGGTLTITLPGGTEDYPDGVVTIDLTETDDEGNEDDIIITLAASYNSGQIEYTVDQDDGIQSATDDSRVELTVRADYTDGRSLDDDGNQLPNEVDATATSIIRLDPPSVDIQIYPSGDPDGDDTQSVLQGQTASFDVVIENTGGFELSNISVASLEDAEAEIAEVRVVECERASSAFEPLAVDESTTAYTCGTTTEETFALRAQVTASGTAQDSEGNAVSLEVTDDDTTTVFFGTVEVDISITALVDPVRYVDDPEAQEGSFTIVGSTPTGTDLENVTITATVTGPAADATAADADDCYREYATVAADDASKPAELGSSGYGCAAKMNEGVNTIEATIQGTIPGTTVVLSATDSVTVEAISPGLTVELTPQDQTIRNGESATITVTVTNGASELTGVSVVDPDPNNEDGLALSGCTTGPNDDSISLGAIGDLAANEQVVITCSTATLTEETGYEAVAIGTARDNTTEPSGVATAVVRILSPSTDVGVSLLDGTSSGSSGSITIQLVVKTVVITETNDGDSDLTDVYVDVEAAGVGPDLTGTRLTRNSPEFVRSTGEGANYDDVLNPGETWEWRVVVVGIAGNVVLLEPDATSIDVTASGYGTDALGGEVSPETDADEIETQSIPFPIN